MTKQARAQAALVRSIQDATEGLTGDTDTALQDIAHYSRLLYLVRHPVPGSRGALCRHHWEAIREPFTIASTEPLSLDDVSPVTACRFCGTVQ